MSADQLALGETGAYLAFQQAIRNLNAAEAHLKACQDAANRALQALQQFALKGPQT